MKLITQDGRELELSQEDTIVYYSDGRRQDICVDEYGSREGYLGTYGYWLVADFIAHDIVNALKMGEKEFKMPPYMHTAAEYHKYIAATKNAAYIADQLKLQRKTA